MNKRKDLFVFNESNKCMVHPKIKLLLSFTHPLFTSNLYDFLSSTEHKRHFKVSW